MKDAFIWEDVHSTFSKIRRFCPLHVVHVKHKGIRFQIFKFGPRHRHPHNKSKTFFSKTHLTPNILKIKLHNSKSMLQQIKRWFIVSRYGGTYNTYSPLKSLPWWDSHGEFCSEVLWSSIWPSKKKGIGAEPSQFLIKRSHNELPITL